MSDTKSKPAPEIVYMNRLMQYGIALHERTVPEKRAVFAMAIIERWALVAAEPDGEDSAGRQKLKMPEPDKLVERAVQIADGAYEAFALKGWLHELPDWETVIERSRESEKRN